LFTLFRYLRRSSKRKIITIGNCPIFLILPSVTAIKMIRHSCLHFVYTPQVSVRKAPFYGGGEVGLLFKSHLPHEERNQSRSKGLLFFRSLCRGVPCPQGPRSPRHKCLVGRFDGKKVHRTFFLIRLTPSSAVRLSAISKAIMPYLSHFLLFRVCKPNVPFNP